MKSSTFKELPPRLTDEFQTTLTDDKVQDRTHKGGDAKQDSGLMLRTSEEEDEIISKAIRRLPSTAKIVSQAVELAPDGTLSPKALKKSLSNAILVLHDNAYSIFRDRQETAYEYALNEWLALREAEINMMSQKIQTLQFAKKICQMVIPFAASLEKRFGNSRKSRAGATLERIIRVLFLKIGIKCEKPSKGAKKKLKRIDIVIPNQETALDSPDKAYFISCKRTLRERWKQSIPERKASWRVYLVTLDNNLSEEKADEIHNEGFITYVLDDVKKQKPLVGKSWIRRLSDLPNDLKLEP